MALSPRCSRRHRRTDTESRQLQWQPLVGLREPQTQTPQALLGLSLGSRFRRSLSFADGFPLRLSQQRGSQLPPEQRERKETLVVHLWLLKSSVGF